MIVCDPFPHFKDGKNGVFWSSCGASSLILGWGGGEGGERGGSSSFCGQKLSKLAASWIIIFLQDIDSRYVTITVTWEVFFLSVFTFLEILREEVWSIIWSVWRA